MKKFITLLLTIIMILSCTSINGVFALNNQDYFAGKQVKITEKTNLIDPQTGKITKSGYSFTPMFSYSRDEIQTASWRTKEWDFYQVSNDRYMLQVTIADISLGGAVTVGFQDMQTGKKYSAMVLKLFTFGSMNIAEDDSVAREYTLKKRNFDFYLCVSDTERIIKFNGKVSGKDCRIDLHLDMLPNHESHYITVPFDTKDGKHFYYNQKTNCMATTGYVKMGGETFCEFKGKEDNSFCVLDWGRGVWPLHEVWWWGNGSTVLKDNDGNEHIFGFEIGWGFGDTTDASESTLFYDGKAYKIGYLKLENQDEIVGHYTDTEWIIKSYEDPECTIPQGSFEMTMTPEYDNYTMLRFVCVGNLCHQVFGKWNGTVKLDDETTLEIKDMKAFLERSDNIW